MGKSPFVIIFFISSAAILAACGDLLQGPVTSPDNHIEINDPGLFVSEDGETIINKVVSAQPGWLCVQADLIGQPGRNLGCSAIPAGESQEVPVSLDLSGLTWTLHPSLFMDNGSQGVLEVPDPDVPVQTPLGRPVTTEAVLLADPAWITVSNQALSADNRVTVERVYAPVPALLVIHDRRDEHVLGYKSLQIGENLTVPVTLEIRGEVQDVFAELHWDSNADGELSLSDPAARVRSGELLMVNFSINKGE